MTESTNYIYSQKINAIEYISVVSVKDVLTWYEGERPDIRARLISYLSRNLRVSNPEIKIVDIKYVFQQENSSPIPKHYYLTKEEIRSGYRYMKYEYKETPLDFYEKELAEYVQTEESVRSLNLTRDTPVAEEHDEVSKVLLEKLQARLPIFSDIQTTHINTAKNIIQESMLPDMSEYYHIIKLWKEVIEKHGFIIPFCQRCGKIEELWKYGKNRILCETCFEIKFLVKPVEESSENRPRINLVLPSFREVSYSEYEKYMRLHKRNEEPMLTESVYVNWRHLLYLPKSAVKSIVKSMCKVQQYMFYQLSLFFAHLILKEKDINVIVPFISQQ